MKLNIGDKAPDFLVISEDGTKVSFKNFEGKNLILYFYPKDDTPGCTLEAKDFSIFFEQFVAKDTVILGISKDSCKSHLAFKAKYQIPFVLLSDEDTQLAEKYDVLEEKSMFGKRYIGMGRTTFLISKERTILKIWTSVKVDGHAEDVLNAINELC